jgi:hypothetical protein
MPDDVPTLDETFTPDQLLVAVGALIERRQRPRSAGDDLRVAFSPAQALAE